MYLAEDRVCEPEIGINALLNAHLETTKHNGDNSGVFQLKDID